MPALFFVRASRETAIPIRYGGITTDFEERKQRHKQKWPQSIVRKVGGKVTEETAREWEKEEGYS